MNKRKKLRLQEYDYSQNGAYFVTICTDNRKKVLSEITVGEGFHPLPEIVLTAIGEEIKKSIEYVNNKIESVFISEYAIMPNHIHMIIILMTINAGVEPRHYGI